MTEEKRPVLSLKRKPARDSTSAVGSDATPAWKVKKEKLELAKRLR